MANLEISDHTREQLEELAAQTGKSVEEVLQFLLNSYGHTSTAELQKRVIPQPLTDKEIIDLLTPKEPLTGREIAECGLLGGWKDEGI